MHTEPPYRALQVLQGSGHFGVALFFVLSAYLITELLRREQERTNSVDLKKFYLRRTLRIWPLSFFALAVSVAIGHFVPSWRVEPRRLIASLCSPAIGLLCFTAVA